MSAPLVVITHGYFEFSGYASLRALIRHTVGAGNVVIYPRWQTDAATPCPGPIDIEPCMTSEVNGIKGALAYLDKRPKRVQPQLNRTSYFGFSFGGIITANLANRYRELGVPKPRAILLEDPHDGAITGLGEPALDDSLAGIPSSTLVQCLAGADGVLSEPEQGALQGSCNAVLPKLTSVPARNKDLVLAVRDDHGTPGLGAPHGICAAGGVFGAVNTYDWGICWKGFDALRSCAYAKVNCRHALDDTPQHRFVGTWSDGVPVRGLKIQDEAPVAFEPAPPRQAAPKRKPETDAPPRVEITSVTSRVRGTAGDDRRVADVQVAIVRRSITRPTTWLAVTGRKRWSLRLPKSTKPGRYRVVAVATDSAGQQKRDTVVITRK